ncbi:Ubiquitin--protein ligase [Bertholletia excelsa]
MVLSWRRRRAAKKKHETDDNAGLEVTIPSHFRCPISLDLMKDPVTLSTGITYDRESIEKWIEGGNYTCPITSQLLRTLEPIPNHSIRKMIQDWCVENKSFGIQRIPTPRIPLTSFQVSEILSKLEAARQQGNAQGCKDLVEKIQGLAKESERNRLCIVDNGTGTALSETFEAFSEPERNSAVLEEILSTLTMFLLPLDEEARFHLCSPASFKCIVWYLRCGDLSARRNAVLLLKEVLSSDDRQHKVDGFLEIEGAVEALFKLVKEPLCSTTTKASLMTIYRVVSATIPAVNEVRARFVEMGMIDLLLEMIIESERSVCERALGVLDELCSSVAGREKAYAQALTIPVLVKKILRVSDLSTDLSVSILLNLGKNEKKEDGGVLVEALQMGAFQKLLLLLQVGCAEKTKDSASELLKLLNLHRGKLECIDSMDFKNLKRPF